MTVPVNIMTKYFNYQYYVLPIRWMKSLIRVIVSRNDRD